MEIDKKNWLISVSYRHGANAGALVGMLQQRGWIGQLLTWIAEQGVENLSPCLVSAKAAGMQDACRAPSEFSRSTPVLAKSVL
jgi:hypothetical protein